jgi:hypothetical protein
VPVRTCAVSFVDIRGIRQVAEVSGGSLYEAAVLGIKALGADEWTEHLGPATVLEIEVREPTTKHVISVQQVERWVDGATTSSNEAVKKAKLKSLPISR